jgi:hypothetical protein
MAAYLFHQHGRWRTIGQSRRYFEQILRQKIAAIALFSPPAAE